MKTGLIISVVVNLVLTVLLVLILFTSVFDFIVMNAAITRTCDNHPEIEQESPGCWSCMCE